MNQLFSEWCIERHRETNHYYAKKIPYEFHLEMAVNVLLEFLPLAKSLTNGHQLRDAVWGHDVMEDCRVTYNDLLAAGSGKFVADIIYAVTNEKGKTRAERANDKYYEGIRNTEGAVFVKLCDRIANVRFSKLMMGRMFEMYKKENTHFLEQMGYHENHELKPMFDCLSNLFKTDNPSDI